MVVAAVASGSMFVFWLFTRALLDDAFALRAWHAGVWLALAALGAFNCLVVVPHRLPAADAAAPTLHLFMGLMPVAWALLAIGQSLAAWREDLVDGRRRLRGVIVAVTAAYTVAQLLAALASGSDLKAVVDSPLNAAGIALLAGVIVWRLVRLRAEELFRCDPVAAPVAARKAPAAAAPVPDATHARQVATLETLMTVQRLYREPNLSIGALALRMGLPEHRLRRVINQGLGHRHFSAFLNAYRIDDARRALRDPARAELPVLMIAMDAGFQSVGPFNRAFKAATGVTPTEYRRGTEPLVRPTPADDPLTADTRIDTRFG